MRLGLIAARKKKRWSQQQLATEIGKEDRSTISHYEQGDCDIPGTVLKKMADVLDTPMDVLLEIHSSEPVTVGSVEG